MSPIWQWTCWFLSTDIHFPCLTVPQYPLLALPPVGLNIFCLLLQVTLDPSLDRLHTQAPCPLTSHWVQPTRTLTEREGCLFLWLPLCRMVMGWPHPSAEGHSTSSHPTALQQPSPYNSLPTLPANYSLPLPHQAWGGNTPPRTL